MPDDILNDSTTEQQQPNYLTKEEFSKSAAYFRKVAEENARLTEMVGALVEKGDDGSFKLKTNATPAAKPESKTPDWQVELNALKTELQKREKEIAEKDRKAADAAKRSAIVDALSKHNAVNPQRDAVHLFDAVKTNSEGKFVTYSKDESGLDVETPIESFVAGFLKSNPELVRASGKAGSGTPNTSVQNGTYDFNDTDMNNFVRNRSELLKQSKRFK